MGPIGDHHPPTPTDLFGRRIEALQAEFDTFAECELTEGVAARIRDIVKKARDLEGDLDAAKKRDKQPHMDANAAIEAEYRPLVGMADTIKTYARKRLDAFLKA